MQKNLQSFCTAYDCNHLKNIKLKELTMIEINKIYNEDCFITMSKMDDASIDIVMTSPPYNIGIDIGGSHVGMGLIDDENVISDMVSGPKNGAIFLNLLLLKGSL